jgi:hypothetical protein
MLHHNTSHHIALHEITMPSSDKWSRNLEVVCLLGHPEVVQVALSQEQPSAQQEFQ